MSKTIAEVVAGFQSDIAELDKQSNALKRKVNELSLLDGTPEPYADVPTDGVATSKSKTVKLRPDEFTADKMMKAMRRYLEMRKAANPDNAPAKAQEIADALRDGGYDFKGKDPLSATSISLGKSTHTFKRLASGVFGLAAWYGNVRPPKGKTDSVSAAAEAEEEDEERSEPEETGNQGVVNDQT